MDHIGSEPQEGEEQMDPPSGQPTGESQLSLRSPKPEAMDADALAGLLFRMGEVPIPEDRVDLVSSTGQGAGLFRDPRFHARGALRSNEDDADRHVIPRTPRLVRDLFPGRPVAERVRPLPFCRELAPDGGADLCGAGPRE